MKLINTLIQKSRLSIGPFQSFQFIFCLSFIFLLSCSDNELKLEKGQVAIRQITATTSIDQQNLERPIEMNYAIDLNLSDYSRYHYILYRTVSRIETPVDQSIEQNDLIHYEVIKEGGVETLKSSELKPHYRTIPFSYSYSVKDHQLTTYKAYNSKSTKHKITGIQDLISIDFLTTAGFNTTTNTGASFFQDIGLIIYPKAEDESLDFSKLFASKFYRDYLHNGGTSHRLAAHFKLVMKDYLSSLD